MYCTRCGRETSESDLYCSQCGARTSVLTATAPRLMRARYDKKIAGVCGGIADYLGVDPTLIRLIWVTLIFVPPSIGLIAYLIAWLVMPKEPLRLPVTEQVPNAV